MNIKSILRSMRLRTLPLSLAGVVMGLGLAGNYDVTGVGNGMHSCGLALLIILTAASLQILSNLCNELGDSLNGTDTEERQGPQYSLNQGEMTVSGLKKLIRAFILLCIAFGTAMIRVSFGTLFCAESYCMLALGAFAIIGAMKYTLGKKPYGYIGLGDIAVFVFFGLVSVCGAYYLVSHSFRLPLFPAISIGLLSVAVLNVNNIRDMKTDASNRRTVAIRLGLRNARIYQTVLIGLAWLAVCVPVNSMRLYPSIPVAPCLPLILLFIYHLKGVWTKTGKDLDPMLPLLVISTFIFAIGLCLCALLLSGR